MRERAIFLHDEGFCRRVAEELADVQARLDESEHRLDEYMQDLGITRLTDEELEALSLNEPPDSETWFGSDTTDQLAGLPRGRAGQVAGMHMDPSVQDRLLDRRRAVGCIASENAFYERPGTVL